MDGREMVSHRVVAGSMLALPRLEPGDFEYTFQRIPGEASSCGLQLHAGCRACGLGTLHERQRVHYELREDRKGRFAAEELAPADQVPMTIHNARG